MDKPLKTTPLQSAWGAPSVKCRLLILAQVTISRLMRSGSMLSAWGSVSLSLSAPPLFSLKINKLKTKQNTARNRAIKLPFSEVIVLRVCLQARPFSSCLQRGVKWKHPSWFQQTKRSDFLTISLTWASLETGQTLGKSFLTGNFDLVSRGHLQCGWGMLGVLHSHNVFSIIPLMWLWFFRVLLRTSSTVLSYNNVLWCSDLPRGQPPSLSLQKLCNILKGQGYLRKHSTITLRDHSKEGGGKKATLLRDGKFWVVNHHTYTIVITPFSIFPVVYIPELYSKYLNKTLMNYQYYLCVSHIGP